MKEFKKIFATLLMMCMVMGLCACGNTQSSDSQAQSNKPSTENSQVADSQENSESEVQDNRTTITVVDESGNPMANVMVQICQQTGEEELCIPAVTDANGVATFTITEGVTYAAKVSALPEGYEYATDEHEFTFSGVTGIIITLKKTA